jgi:DASH complex subunit SPC19
MASASTAGVYAHCVAAMRQSLAHLDTTVTVLDAGVADLPRVGGVLAAVRHYELIPQPTLQAAEASLRDEIGPSIVLLLDRAERQLDRLARRVDTLKARSELQAGRLASTSSSAAAATTTTTGGVKRKAGNRLARADEARFKARALRARKDALLYSIQRLELEALQKEREHSRRAQ